MHQKEAIKAVSFREELIGKLIGISKKKLSWVFKTPAKAYTIILKYSIFSSKFTFKLNDAHKYKGERKLLSKFEYQTNFEGLHFRILEGMFTFDLYINGSLFQPGATLKPTFKSEKEIPQELSQRQRISCRETPKFFMDGQHSPTSINNQKHQIGILTKGIACFKKKFDVRDQLFKDEDQNVEWINKQNWQTANKQSQQRATSDNVPVSNKQYINSKNPNLVHEKVFDKNYYSTEQSTRIESSNQFQTKNAIKMRIFKTPEIAKKIENTKIKNLTLNSPVMYEVENENFWVTDFTVYTSIERNILKKMF